MLILLAALAFADDIGEVQAGSTYTLEGPAVWMAEEDSRHQAARGDER